MTARVLVNFAFGRRLGHARRRRGFTRAALAEFAGISVGQLAACEGGTRRPDAAELVRLAEGLGIPVEVLADGGVAWTHWCLAAGRVLSPHVFEAPTQYPDALSHDAALPPPAPFRERPDMSTAPAIAARPPPACRRLPPSPVVWRPPPAPEPLPERPLWRPATEAGVCRICRKPGTFVMGICGPCWRGEEP